MALASGTKLGPYEIVAPLGAGGMGEVYRARDTRLGRDVAIKVLPSHLSSNPDLKARFEREAKAISALNHPHICHLYDVGSQDGTDFLVMGALGGRDAGRPAAERRAPQEQVLRIGAEVASAPLDAAHHHGVVHRDLKLGNIMLTKSGAKLLDFGVAKPVTGLAPAAVASDADRQQTFDSGGQLLALISTWHLNKSKVRKQMRARIFCAGVRVLYEMTTGARAFKARAG
jgi:serine/threonine protein kinase